MIGELKDSRLLGRGGAAFPTGVKWEAVAGQSAQPHYVVCNADESEPGTFKDRVTMESDPFALVEAIAVAAFATGAGRAFIYVRAEYPLAHERLRNAIEQSRPHLDGVEIELRIGAGAYVCRRGDGSLPVDRGLPRRAAQQAAVPGGGRPLREAHRREQRRDALQRARGAARRRQRVRAHRHGGSTGTRLFCVSGCVDRPGLYELPFGATLRELLDLAGSAPPKAVLLAERRARSSARSCSI